MAKLHKISVGNDSFHARSGQIVLDAALLAGVELPHDCRAGRCGTCLARVHSGMTIGGQSDRPGHIHACQAMVFSDLVLEYEPRPEVSRTRGRIAHVAELASDVVEVAIDTPTRIAMLSGQYCRFRFQGYPDRPFSPTAPMAAIADDGYLYLHVKRVPGGRVTAGL